MDPSAFAPPEPELLTLEGEGPLLPKVVHHFFHCRRYQSESDEYSKLVATAFQADLLEHCPTLANWTLGKQLCHEVNGPLFEFHRNEEWDGHRWDLVTGLRATTNWKTTGQRQTPRERLRAHRVAPPNNSSMPAFWDRPEGAVHRAHVAVEIKASIKKANPTVRLGEFAIAYRWAHEHDRRTIAVALLVLDTRDPAQAASTVKTLDKLKRRATNDEIGLDALVIVPFGLNAQSTPIPENAQYGNALRHLSARYRENWS